MKAIFAFILCSLLLVGCTAAPENSPAPTESPVIEATVEPSPSPVIEPSSAPETPESSPEPEHMITLYAANEDVSGFIYASYPLYEITPSTVSAALIEAGVMNEDCVFNSIEQDGSQIKLDVNEAFVNQLNSYGSSGEYYMLGSVVNTLLGAYAADSVYITVNGQLIETGHNVYDFPLEFYS